MTKQTQQPETSNGKHIYVCPSCDTIWTYPELYAVLEDNEDLVVMLVACDQCPNCTSMEL